jgi:hypothetical protein
MGRTKKERKFDCRIVGIAILISVVIVFVSYRRPERARRSCVDYEKEIEAAHSSDSRPQLSKNQIHWIADELYAAGLGKGVSTNLLVFGLGKDSILWRKLNCLGRTVFIENWKEWINKILALDPSLEVYEVQYNTTLDKADEFFSQPWSLPVPSSVASDCFDVVLVDAPQGYSTDPKAPGIGDSRITVLWSHNQVQRVTASTKI